MSQDPIGLEDQEQFFRTVRPGDLIWVRVEEEGGEAQPMDAQLAPAPPGLAAAQSDALAAPSAVPAPSASQLVWASEAVLRGACAAAGAPPAPEAVIVSMAHAALREAGFSPNDASACPADAAAATSAGVGQGARRQLAHHAVTHVVA
jgi:hypothetical protein